MKSYGLYLVAGFGISLSILTLQAYWSWRNLQHAKRHLCANEAGHD